MKSLRVGLIGLGMMGRQHARVLSMLEGVELVGAYDPRVNSSSPAKECKHFESLDELLKKGIDYAVVAVPTNIHFEIALKLASKNISCLIEKPLSHDSISAWEIAEVFSSRRLVGAVGHIERFNPAVQEAKRRLHHLGALHQVATRRLGPFPGRVSDVGVVKDLATHDIDLTMWISGQDYAKVTASVLYRSGRANEDLLASVCTLTEGTVSNHLVNWLSPMKERKIVLTGEKGSLEIDTLTIDLTFYANGTTKNEWQDIARFRGVSEGDITRIALSKREPLLVEHENFRDAILGKPAEIVSLREGSKTLEVAESMLKSALLGGEVQKLAE